MSWRTFYPKVQSADNRVQTKKEKYVLPKPSEKNNFIRHCCNKTWTSEKDYKEHLKIAHTTVRERKYICSICKKDFCTKQQYRRHVNQDHPKREKHPALYLCSFCHEKPFEIYSEVYKHIIIYHRYQLKRLNNGRIPKSADCDKYIFRKCIFCGKIFFEIDIYKQHYLEHVQAEGKE